MGTYLIYYGSNSFKEHLFMGYSKEAVIRKAKEEGMRRGVDEIRINRSTGKMYGGIPVGTWERHGSRWYKV